jgi:hypothetical protein
MIIGVFPKSCYKLFEPLTSSHLAPFMTNYSIKMTLNISSNLATLCNNNNNQAFYSQASWGRLEMKPHEKKRYKTRAKKKGKTTTKGNKRKEPKIKVLIHELLASTLSYLMLAPW